ncbi:ATPase family associated with various cellular activities (AAA) [Trypanosoma brucei equiperdum]|uniref:ATPase family associated with various cellular activities (AAA) n=1 Tax=Trypanosoma brucei equiperdum TaxID=630700 RepID=A0A3L6KTX9_9TRYP|nr:ATPase family associated with various cellular activities (AAA) [Trypanosoma brucei equiperdum]
MSSLTCEELYRRALDDLTAIWREDVNVSKMKVMPTGRQRYDQLLLCWASLYVQYLRTGRRLVIVHDAQLQPQKRYDVRTVLDACMARMLELRALLSTNCGEFVKLDECILDLKMTPDELEVPIPHYFVEDNASVMQERRRQIASLQQYYKETEPDAPVTKALTASSVPPQKKSTEAAAGNVMSMDEALMLLKINERGRQARERAKFQLSMYAQKRHSVELASVYNHPTGRERAATVLQSAVQAYLTRKHIFSDHQEELQLLGMAPSADSTNREEAVQAEARLDEQKARQRMNEANFRQKTLEIESRIKTEEGPRTMELMLNEALTRMAYARMEGKDDQGMLQAADVSGSRRLADSSNQAGSLAPIVTDSFRSPAPNISGTFPSAGGTGNDARNAMRRTGSVSARRRGEEDETVPAMPPSVLWETIRAEDERYSSLWKPRFEQTYVREVDLDQSADLVLLRQQLLEGPRGVMEELRHVVDELILMEVENLKKRLEQERRSGKRKGAKKKKGPRKPRAPKLKDPTKGSTVETLMNTAVHQNVLKLPDSEVVLSGYLGCVAVHESPLDALLRAQKPDDDMRKKWQRILNNWDANVEKVMKMKKDAFQKVFDKYLQQSTWLAEPTAAHVRQSVTEYAILPLGSQVIHDLAPSSKTLLLYGFHGTGKTHLVHAVCNHSGANFFDLSPANFETETGLAGIIQTVFYLAKVMAPSVIYIDNVEKLFLRKKRKGPKDPLMKRGRKMKKEVLKGIASISPTDRVIVIGCTCAPYDAEFNAMVNNFAHMVYCGCPDYASRVVVLQELAGSHTGDVWSLKPEHYHELALLTEGFTCGDISAVFEEVLTKRRLRRIEQRPLTADDFLSAVARAKPPSVEDRALMKEFTARLPLHLRRVNPIADIPLPEKETAAKKRPKKKE